MRDLSEPAQLVLVVTLKNAPAVCNFGFGISDYVVSPDGAPLGAFLHCNPRHHSLAFFQIPMGPRKIQHVMFETNSLDDVGTSYDLCLEREITATSLGRHGNDRSFSFYFRNLCVANC
jgi:extradiol dioxygenase